MRHLLREPDLAIGKTVEGVHGGPYSEFVALHFTDGTSLVIGCESDTDGGADMFIVRTHASNEMNVHDRANYGLITPEEYKALREVDTAKREREKEHHDRAEYERLRQRFESVAKPDAVDPVLSDSVSGPKEEE